MIYNKLLAVRKFKSNLLVCTSRLAILLDGWMDGWNNDRSSCGKLVEERISVEARVLLTSPALSRTGLDEKLN